MAPEHRPYRSPKILSYLAIATLAGILVINIFNIFVGLGEIFLPQDINIDDGESLEIWIAITGLLALLDLFLRLLAAIFFLSWLYRIFSNFSSLRILSPEHSPGWAIGYWFIPVINLVKPYLIVQEAWRKNDPGADPNANILPGHGKPNYTILIWWLVYLVSNISSRIADAMFEKTSNGYFARALMIMGFLVAAAAYLGIQVVSEITARQEERARKVLSAEDFAAPPPPPTFT